MKAYVYKVYLFWLLGLSACTNEVRDSDDFRQKETRSEQQESNMFTVSATEICGDFQANHQHALQKYNNRLIQVSGIVSSVQTNNEEECDYMIIACHSESDSPDMVIKCCLAPERAQQADTAWVGGEITIVARFKDWTDQLIVLEEVHQP